MNDYHESVLKDEVDTFLSVTPSEKYIDTTLGGGGHAERILELGGIALGIDIDQDAIDYVEKKFKVKSSKLKIWERLTLVRGNFRDIDTIAKEYGFTEVAGILFDLGVSSHQFDTGERGFSFLKDSELDMRMDKSGSFGEVKAKDLINGLRQNELADLIYRFGEEYFSRHIAQEIVKARAKKPIETTRELARIIEQKYPKKGEIHPATKVFQALRIAVNDELASLEEALPKAVELLQENGRLLVISFHSLEDRIVKDTFKQFEKKGIGRIITKKPIGATDEEIKCNRRSRSAKLRVFEKI